jgi:hypothetical protein
MAVVAYGLRMRNAVALGMTLSLAGILAGCSPDTVMPTPPPDPTSTPVFASDEEALAAAEDAYARYLEVSNDLGEGGWLDSSALSTVLRGEALDEELATAESFSANGYMQIGRSTFDTATLQQWESDADTISITVYLCLDVTGVDVVDSAGTSIVAPDRADRRSLEVAIDNEEDDFKVSGGDVWSGQSFC